MSFKVKYLPKERKNSPIANQAYVGLSLSNKISTSESSLAKIFEWTSENSNSFEIFIGDYCHRHNLEGIDGLEQDVALKKAIQDGKVISNRVSAVLEKLGNSKSKIILASELKDNVDFIQYLETMKKLYEQNTLFRNLIEKATYEFFKRIAPQSTISQTTQEYSRDYQLEELSFFQILSLQGYSMNIYPGAHIPIMKDIVNKEFKGLIPSLEELTLVELRFWNVS